MRWRPSLALVQRTRIGQLWQCRSKEAPPWGAIVVVTGLVAIVAVFVVAVLHYKNAADVTTAVGAVSGVIAALVGAYFGIRGAILAQGNAEHSAGNTKG